MLFVIGGRNEVDENEMKFFELLRDTIFNEDIIKHTTIVRTKFHSFAKEEKCRIDIEYLKKNTHTSKIAKLCEQSIIHVDNPPINVDDKDEKRINMVKRELSRTILLTHLANCQGIYRPRKLQE